MNFSPEPSLEKSPSSYLENLPTSVRGFLTTLATVGIILKSTLMMGSADNAQKLNAEHFKNTNTIENIHALQNYLQERGGQSVSTFVIQPTPIIDTTKAPALDANGNVLTKDSHIELMYTHTNKNNVIIRSSEFGRVELYGNDHGDIDSIYAESQNKELHSHSYHHDASGHLVTVDGVAVGPLDEALYEKAKEIFEKDLNYIVEKKDQAQVQNGSIAMLGKI